MAGDAIVGALRVVLGMDTASFEDGLKKGQSQLATFGKNISQIAAGIGIASIVEKAFATITHELKAASIEAIKFADDMGKMAQKVGLPVEQLTALRVAAELSDVSMETLSKSLGILSKNMVEAAGTGGKTKQIFKDLGIALKDSSGNTRSVLDVLADLAGKFEGSADGAKKTAAALALLGRGGKDMIPLLNEGKDALKEWAKVAEHMGLIVLPETANQAQKFNDDLKLLNLAKQGVANTVMKELLPALVRLSGQFAESAKSGDLIKASADKIVNVIKEVVVGYYQLIVADEILGQSLLALQDLFTNFFKLVKPGVLIIQKDFVGAFKAMSEISVGDTLDAMRDALTRLGTATSGWTPKMEEARRKALALFDTIIVEGKKAKNELNTFTETPLSKELDRLALQTRILKGDFNNLTPGLAEMAVRLKLAKEDGSDLVKLMAEGLSPALIRANAALRTFLQAKLTEETLAPWDLYIQKMEKLNATFPEGERASRAYTITAMKNATDLALVWGQTAQAIVSPMASAFRDLASMNKKYAGAAKAAAIAEATINTYLAATKALASVPPPFNYIAAAATVAAGLAQVAKISATEFQTGGSFKVGGTGGVDSQLVAIRATPGEMVDVRRPDSSGRGAGGVQTIELRSPNPRDFFVQHVRELVETLNAAAPDGYIIKVA